MKLKNGKLLKDALEGIAKYKKATHFLMKDPKKPYYEYREYAERLNSVLGADGFVARYKVESPLVFPSEQVMVVVSCTIDILSEDGTVALSVNGIGSEEVDRSSDSGKYIGLNNCMLFAQQSAFKSACRELDIFSCNSKGKDEQGLSGQENGRSSIGNYSGAGRGDTVTFYVKKAIEVVRTDRGSGKNVYKLIGHVCDGDGYAEAESEVVFYPSGYKECEEKVNACVAKKTPYRISLEVKPVSGKAGSYVFKAFPGGN